MSAWGDPEDDDEDPEAWDGDDEDPFGQDARDVILGVFEWGWDGIHEAIQALDVALAGAQMTDLEQQILELTLAQSLEDGGWRPQPAPPLAIERIRRISTGKNEECAICLEDHAPADAALPCGHSFHDACVREWLRTYGHTCPVCRAAVDAPEAASPDLEAQGYIKTTAGMERTDRPNVADTGGCVDPRGHGADAAHDLASSAGVSVGPSSPGAPSQDVPGDLGAPGEPTPD